MANIIVGTLAGDSFGEVALKAKDVAEQDYTAEFDFNGITCLVNKDTNLDLLWRDYLLCWTMEWKTIGPLLPVEHAPDVQAEIDRRKKQNEQKQAEADAAYQKKIQVRRELLLAEISREEFQYADKDAWDKWVAGNTDPYGAGIISYAKQWALLMQARMDGGLKLHEIAQEASQDADTDGITGFMYGAAVQVLSKTWAHGEDLRKWHNKEYNHEWDGVVNPAILTVSP